MTIQEQPRPPKGVVLWPDGHVSSATWLLAIHEGESWWGAEVHVLERPDDPLHSSPREALCGLRPSEDEVWLIPFQEANMPLCQGCRDQVVIIEREAQRPRARLVTAR